MKTSHVQQLLSKGHCHLVLAYVANSNSLLAEMATLQSQLFNLAPYTGQISIHLVSMLRLCICGSYKGFLWPLGNLPTIIQKGAHQCCSFRLKGACHPSPMISVFAQYRIALFEMLQEISCLQFLFKL